MELSIVLVILGLLVGGILAGRSLIRAAELRAVSTEAQRYIAAIHAFRDKYFGLPGDLANATSFWGAEPVGNCPGDETTPSTSTATCNGNGNGNIAWSGNAGYGGESHRFWQHLANAGLIEGQFTGTHSAGACNTTGTCNTMTGSNAPLSRLGSNTGWSTVTIGNAPSGHQYYFPGYYGLALYFGGQVNGAWTYGAVLKPDEAWNIDQKVDDGLPATGKFVPWNRNNFANCSTASETYALDYGSNACQFIVKTGL